MQLAVLDQMNPSRLLAKIDVDAYLHDVTIVVDIINKPPHGRCELSFTISIRLSDRLSLCPVLVLYQNGCTNRQNVLTAY